MPQRHMKVCGTIPSLADLKIEVLKFMTVVLGSFQDVQCTKLLKVI